MNHIFSIYRVVTRTSGFLFSAAGAAVMLAGASSASAAVTIDWAPVGDPGNMADPRNNVFGSVPYTYEIGRTEVTNAQFVQFLNAKAAADPFALYDTNMSTDGCGGILRSGTSGNYSYAVKSGFENMPVVNVNWYTAVRFVNWLHNGQGSGDTETGAYTLLGGTSTPSNAMSVTRNAAAKVFLPSANEWYKAAFYQPPSAEGGERYWFWPTQSNDWPKSDQPPGDPALQSNAANIWRDDHLANGYDDGFAVTGSTDRIAALNYLTEVGAYSAAASWYGTLDQTGNVTEWLESLNGPKRMIWGDSWMVPTLDFSRDIAYMFALSDDLGFRVARFHEPAALAPLLVGIVGLLRRGRKQAAPR